MSITLLIALVIFSYLLGNISWARVIARRHKVDITKQGSGNPGATNTLRTLGGKAGVEVFLLDILKGALPALVAVLVFGGYTGIENGVVLTGTNDSYLALYLCGVATVLGHAFPIVYQFKGGKGVASVFGMFIVAQPICTLVIFLVCFLVMLLVKYMSVMSMTFVTLLVVLQLCFMPENASALMYIVLAMIWALTIFFHRSNIVRLVKGQENKTDLLKYFKKRASKTVETSQNMSKSSENDNDSNLPKVDADEIINN